MAPQNMRCVEAGYSIAPIKKDNLQFRNSSLIVVFWRVGNDICVSGVVHIGVVISMYSQITSLSWYCHFSLWKEFWFVFIFNYSFCSTEHFINSIICEVDFCTWLAKQMLFLIQNLSLYAMFLLWDPLHVLGNSHNNSITVVHSVLSESQWVLTAWFVFLSSFYHSFII